MDPVSAIGLAASIAGLADFTVTVIARLYSFSTDVISAPKRAEELRQELSSLVGLLKTLEQTLKTEPQSSTAMKKALEDVLGPLRDLVRELDQKTQPEKIKGFGRLKWPFNKDDNNRYCARIESHKGSLLVALNMEHRYTCARQHGLKVSRIVLQKSSEQTAQINEHTLGNPWHKETWIDLLQIQ